MVGPVDTVPALRPVPHVGGATAICALYTILCNTVNPEAEFGRPHRVVGLMARVWFTAYTVVGPHPSLSPTSGMSFQA